LLRYPLRLTGTLSGNEYHPQPPAGRLKALRLTYRTIRFVGQRLLWARSRHYGLPPGNIARDDYILGYSCINGRTAARSSVRRVYIPANRPGDADHRSDCCSLCLGLWLPGWCARPYFWQLCWIAAQTYTDDKDGIGSYHGAPLSPLVSNTVETITGRPPERFADYLITNFCTESLNKADEKWTLQPILPVKLSA